MSQSKALRPGRASRESFDTKHTFAAAAQLPDVRPPDASNLSSVCQHSGRLPLIELFHKSPAFGKETPSLSSLVHPHCSSAYKVWAGQVVIEIARVNKGSQVQVVAHPRPEDEEPTWPEPYAPVHLAKYMVSSFTLPTKEANNMILVFNLDDMKVLNEAYGPGKYPVATYGVAWCFVPNNDYTRIGRTENLFITAHGDKKEIGNKEPRTGLDYTAANFAALLHQKFLPVDYQGTIFLSTCQSAPVYSQALKNSLKEAHPSVTVMGMKGDVDMDIAAPGDPNWIPAK